MSLLRVKKLTVNSQLSPPLRPNEPNVSTSIYMSEYGYAIWRNADGSEYFIHKCDKDDPEGKPIDGGALISVPATHVCRVEYFSYEESPLGAKAVKAEAEEAEVKRGPGRPRIHPLA